MATMRALSQMRSMCHKAVPPAVTAPHSPNFFIQPTPSPSAMSASAYKCSNSPSSPPVAPAHQFPQIQHAPSWRQPHHTLSSQSCPPLHLLSSPLTRFHPITLPGKDKSYNNGCPEPSSAPSVELHSAGGAALWQPPLLSTRLPSSCAAPERQAAVPLPRHPLSVFPLSQTASLSWKPQPGPTDAKAVTPGALQAGVRSAGVLTAGPKAWPRSRMGHLASGSIGHRGICSSPPINVQQSADVSEGQEGSSHGGDDPLVEVCFVDPRTVLDPSTWKHEDSLAELEEEGGICSVKVPQSLVRLLHQGHHELGEGDEPLNSWTFGMRGEELFQYRMVGQHKVQSGFTSIIPSATLASISQGAVKGLPSWIELQHLMRAPSAPAARSPQSPRGSEGGGAAQLKAPSSKHPFLFAGRMLETDVAAVYTCSEGGRVVGLLVSSAAA